MINIENILYKIKKKIYIIKKTKKFKDIGIPILKCDICGDGVVEWIGQYNYGNIKIDKVNKYNICDFCKKRINSKYFLSKRYENEYLLKLEKSINGK